MDDDDFEDWVETVDDDAINQLGGFRGFDSGMSELLQDAELVNVGRGVYKVLLEGRPVENNDGGIFMLDYNALNNSVDTTAPIESEASVQQGVDDINNTLEQHGLFDGRQVDSEPGIAQGVTTELGSLSQKFESGTSGAGTVSSGRGDPGGVSYGTFQLSSKAGTAASFMKFMTKQGQGERFKGLKPGTPAFSKAWKEEAAANPNFENLQKEYIKKTHFDPVRKHATSEGVPDNEAVNQVLWSIGVQHGGAKGIVSRAKIKPSDDTSTVINKLYDSRIKYVKGLKMAASTKQSLLNRYTQERKDALALT